MTSNRESVSAKIRLVLDTNVWLDWLVFDDIAIVPIREALAAKRVEILIDAACEAELERVLAYDLGPHTLDAAARGECIAECRRVARRVDAPLSEAQRARLPACRDADDQKFLEAAFAAGAQFLLTRDRALLELAHHEKAHPRALPFRVVTPEGFADDLLPRSLAKALPD